MKLSIEHARRVLLATVGPRALPESADRVLATLAQVQVDPIDRIGANADLVALARTETLQRGDIYQAQGFEHYAKEWCLLPPSAFPYYRKQALKTPTWRHTRRMEEVPEAVLSAVFEEVEQMGPCTAVELSDHGCSLSKGSVWTGSGKVGTLALHVLALRCRLVVTGRRGGTRIYDVPERALPDVWKQEPEGAFLRWAVLERVRASGMLGLNQGPWWSMIRGGLADRTVEALLAEGELREVTVEGARRRYLVRPASLEATPEVDDRMRLLGPLDPMMWNRGLVEQVFGFRYVWEVYKPAVEREWGYYVVPLLHRGHLVGRFEGRVVEGRLEMERLWREHTDFDETAFEAMLGGHALKLGCSR